MRLLHSASPLKSVSATRDTLGAADTRYYTDWSGVLKRFFPTKALGHADFAVGTAFLTACFVLFLHDDIWGVGWDSLNYLFGSPMEFYENCKRIRGAGDQMLGTPYPPPIYMIFALWLYPWKLFGVITSAATLPHYLTYWLKILTSLVYATSGVTFYRISLEYSPDKAWAKYATAAWLTMPLALFSQLIFSQYDIFYVALTMVGFLMFLRRRLWLASVYFGVAITFKYFPAFVFLPLLLLHEKRVSRLALQGVIFIMPTVLINAFYGTSPAFIEGVHEHFSLERVYAATFDIGLSGLWNAYFLPTSCAIICGVAYLTAAREEYRARMAAYLWMASAVVPFLFIYWHPQWVISFAPPLVLTSMLLRNSRRWLSLDLVGMLFYIATVSLTFVGKADAALFQGSHFGLELSDAYLMADDFSWFGVHSLNVFYSGLCAYLLLHIVIKYKPLFREAAAARSEDIDYGPIRSRFYIGLLIFLLPVSFSIYRDLTGSLVFINNFAAIQHFGALFGPRVFEQPFVARGTAVKQVSLLLESPPGPVRSDIQMEIIDASGATLVRMQETVYGGTGTAWHHFRFDPVPVSKDASYKVRLTSPTNVAGNGVAWWASYTYKRGQAMVDGVHQSTDFSYRIGFLK